MNNCQEPTARAGRKRLAVARFWYEGNAFAPLPADMTAFQRCEWATGQAALDAARGTATELGAVATFADAHPEWDVVVLRCASALPAGPIDDAVFDCFAQELDDGIAAGVASGGWDAVYLSLHGAAITATRQAPDLDLVRLVRHRVPGVPLGASFDLHGNISPELASLLDIASVYRTHPHVDMAETAARVLDGLARCAGSTLATRCTVRNDGILLPSFNMRTVAGPMRKLEDAARGLTGGPIIEVCVFGGFPYADTRDTGASILVVADTRRDANGAVSARVTAEMSDLIHRLAPAFAVTLLSPEQAIAHALASTQPGLIAITDPADNPLSGGACDTPGLLRALLAAQVAVPTVFASFADAEVVAAAEQAGVGRSIEVTLGGRYGAHFGAPVQLRARVERVTDGVFRNTGPMSTGVERRCGGSTVLVVTGQANLRIVVTSEVVPADDPAFYALHRIEAQDVRLLCVKAKNHFRAGMGAACSEIIDCDAPGPACADLTQLPFRNLRHSAASAAASA
jgi:microcystin degradation protein MlrC